MPTDRIVIKGTSSGLIITIGRGVWPGLLEDLDRSLGEKASFFKGGRVALHVGPRQLTRLQLETAGQILSRHHVTLWAVESDAPGTREAARQLGLETNLSPPRPVVDPAQNSESLGNSSVIQRTLRSGQVIHHSGHVVIIGDVNPGAEVRAGGSVVVWGRLRGSVHAGVENDYGERAVVCALQLSPMQLRIGGRVSRSPAENNDHEIMPEMATVQDGQIVAEAWNG
jgi:septum site-determining protein MinC